MSTIVIWRYLLNQMDAARHDNGEYDSPKRWDGVEERHNGTDIRPVFRSS